MKLGWMKWFWYQGASASSDMEEETEERDGGRVKCVDWQGRNPRVEQFGPLLKKTTPCPGITHCALSHITLYSSFDFVITGDIIQIIVAMTKLQRQRNYDKWADVDAVEIRGNIRPLILAVNRTGHLPCHHVWVQVPQLNKELSSHLFPSGISCYWGSHWPLTQARMSASVLSMDALSNSPGRSRIKVCILCDVPTAYVLNMQPYLGKSNHSQRSGSGSR